MTCFSPEKLRESIGKTIIFEGWLRQKRNHGGLLFWEIRRNDSMIQVVFQEENLIDKASIVSNESTVKLVGILQDRSRETVNDKIINGDLEILANEFQIVTKAASLPFQVNNCNVVNEDIMQRYRYLYLREGIARQNIKIRSKVFNSIRQYMIDRDFIDVQTPILTSSSPEGARDFLIPSRLHLKKFYALPQSPQIFKQLLMLSGIEKYFQIAPCFRDEDARIDRSPGEFYQLDFEICFPENENTILQELQNLIIFLYNNFAKKKLASFEFPIITFNDAINLYGTDKPDLRNKVQIKDVTEYFMNNNFKIFKEKIEKGERVIGFIIPEHQERKFFDKILKQVKEDYQLLLAYTYKENEEWYGPIAKFMNDDFSFGEKGMFFFCSDESTRLTYMSKLHQIIAEVGNFIDKSQDYFCFVVDFPMFEWDDEEKKWNFTHNPFSMPKNYSDNVELNQVISSQYDLVCNGLELCSGAIRNHNLELFQRVCKRIGYDIEYIKSAFPAIMEGFTYGVPRHGGAAIGLERLIMLLVDTERIRDVIPFPLLQNGKDLMMNAPSVVTKKQLKELGINYLQ